MVYATDGRGGGNAIPPYIQARQPFVNTISGAATKPVITPKSAVVPGEAKKPLSLYQRLAQKPKPKLPTLPITVQPNTPASAPQTPVPQTLYDFFKQDLENQRKSAMSGAVSDASARGVYYGTPLTTSQGDIQTEYLRGLGQLQSGVLQNEQQNELSRLGIAGNLLNSTPQVGGGGIDPAVFQMLGTLFGGNQAVAGQRTGPITPKNTNPPELNPQHPR